MVINQHFISFLNNSHDIFIISSLWAEVTQSSPHSAIVGYLLFSYTFSRVISCTCSRNGDHTKKKSNMSQITLPISFWRDSKVGHWVLITHYHSRTLDRTNMPFKSLKIFSKLWQHKSEFEHKCKLHLLNWLVVTILEHISYNKYLNRSIWDPHLTIVVCP